MKPPIVLILPVLAVVMVASTFAAQDPSIDRLLGKLQPPEKFVDPAVRDPLAQQMEAAMKAGNIVAAFEASRRLAARYQKSLAAQVMYGTFALAVRRSPEASSAFRRALKIQPDFALAHLGLAVAEISQQHFRAALPEFQQVTRLAPKAEMGWTGASACAERLGRLQESLGYARRATVVAPSSAAAWLQLARIEGLSGNKPAAANAFARAKKLQGSAPRSSSSRKLPRRGR